MSLNDDYSLLTGCVFGRSDAQVRERCKFYGDMAPEELRESGNIVGTASQVSEQLVKLEETGIDRVMLQWLDLDDLVGLESLAKVVL